MNNDKLKKILSGFDKNQLEEINRFLNSADGQRFKNNISEKDKADLLKRLDSLDPNQIRKSFSGLSKNDITRMINRRK